MRFILEIKLGNDAMQDRMDVAGALERVSHTLAASPLPDDTQSIRDLNGQPVGRWRFEDATGAPLTHVWTVDTDEVDPIWVFTDEGDARRFAATYTNAAIEEQPLITHERAREIIAEAEANR